MSREAKIIEKIDGYVMWDGDMPEFSINELQVIRDALKRAVSSHKPADLLVGWEDVCRRVKGGIRRLGHDIQIVGYGSGDEVKIAAAERKTSR